MNADRGAGRGSLLGRATIRAGASVAVGLGVWSLGNFVFFIVAGRLLGPEDYGLASALLAASLVISVPFSSFQPALASTTGGGYSPGLYTRAIHWGIRGTTVGIIAGAALILVCELLYSPTPAGPMLATLAVVSPVAILPLSLGRLQGEQRFGAFSTTMGMLGGVRPFAFLMLFAIGLGLYAALLGSAVAALVATGTALVLTSRALREPIAPVSSEAWRSFRRGLLPNVIAISSIALLTNVDIIAGKLALDDRPAGVFAAVGALAKAVFFVGQTVATVSLPRVARRRSAGTQSADLVALSAGVSLLGGGAVAVVLAFGAAPILDVTFGQEFESGARLLGAYTGAMALMGVLVVLAYHQIARRTYRYSIALMGVAVLQIVLLAAFHGSGDAIIAVDYIAAVCAIACHEIVQRTDGESITEGVRQLLRRRRADGGL